MNLKQLSNVRLLQAAQNGHQPAYWELWQRLAPQVQRQVSCTVQNRDDIEDIVQEVQNKVRDSILVRRHTIRTLQSWLHTVVKNVCNDYFKDKNREIVLPLYQLEACIAELKQYEQAQLLEKSQNLDEIMQYVHSLPGRFRSFFIMRKIEKLSYDEIARITSMSTHAVEQRVYLAECRLRRLIKGECRLWVEDSLNRQITHVRFAPVLIKNQGIHSLRVHMADRVPLRSVRVSTIQSQMEKHPGGWRPLLELADIHFATGQWESAAGEYKQVLSIQPNQMTVWLRLGRIYRETGNTEAAVETYRQARVIAPTTACRLHCEAWIAVCNDRIACAVELFKRAAQHDKNNPAYWHDLGFIARDQQLDMLSVEAFDHALEIDRNDMVALAGSHDALHNLDRNAELISRLYRAVSLNENDPTALKLLAVHRCENGFVWNTEGKKTLQLARRAVQNAPHSTEAYESLCNYYYSRGRYYKEVGLWESFLNDHPADSRAWRKYARALLKTARVVDANQAMQRSLDIAGDNFFVLLDACDFAAEQGDAVTTQTCIQNLLHRYPDFWQTYTISGYALAVCLHQPAQGCNVARRAVEMHPEVPRTWRQYAEVLWAAERKTEAVAAQEKAFHVTQGLRHPRYTLDIAKRCLLTNQQNEGRNWLHAVLEDADQWRCVSPTMALFFKAQALELLGCTSALQTYEEALQLGLLQHDELICLRKKIQAMRK